MERHFGSVPCVECIITHVVHNMCLLKVKGERGCSVVERLTPKREVGVRILPPSYCVIEQDTLLPQSTGNTQEAVAPSRHD